MVVQSSYLKILEVPKASHIWSEVCASLKPWRPPAARQRCTTNQTPLWSQINSIVMSQLPNSSCHNCGQKSDVNEHISNFNAYWANVYSENLSLQNNTPWANGPYYGSPYQGSQIHYSECTRHNTPEAGATGLLPAPVIHPASIRFGEPEPWASEYSNISSATIPPLRSIPGPREALGYHGDPQYSYIGTPEPDIFGSQPPGEPSFAQHLNSNRVASPEYPKEDGQDSPEIGLSKSDQDTQKALLEIKEELCALKKRMELLEGNRVNVNDSGPGSGE